MANVETRHNEYTFLGSGYSINEHIFYEQRLDYESILSRSGRAVAARRQPVETEERVRKKSERHCFSASRAPPDLSGLERGGNAVPAFQKFRLAVGVRLALLAVGGRIVTGCSARPAVACLAPCGKTF